MAKIFSAADLRKRSANSGKVSEVLHGIMNRLVAHADNGGTTISVSVEHDVVDAIVRKLKTLGFHAEYNSCYGRVTIDWKENSGDCNGVNIICVPTAKSDTADVHKASDTKTTDEKHTAQADNRDKKSADVPTKDECDTKRATQTCTAEDDSKEAHDATATEKPATENANNEDEPKANDKKQTVGIMRSVVFENCTFNVSIPISIPVDVHHNRVFNTRNIK